MYIACPCFSFMKSCFNISPVSDNKIQTSSEQRLIHDLLKPYQERGTVGRPLQNTSHGQKMNVYMGMRLMNIDLDEAHQVMTTSAWLRMVRKNSS